MPTRIEKELPCRFPSAALYMSDIMDIIAIMEEETEKQVGITDAKYVYESLDDLIEHNGKAIGCLGLLSANSLGCRLAFTLGRPLGNMIAIDTGDIDQDRVIHGKISDIVDNRKMAVAATMRLTELGWLGTSLLCIAACVLLAWSFSASYQQQAAPASLYFLPVIGMLALVVIGLYAKDGAWSKVYLVNQHEKPETFFRRYRDKIILCVVTGIIVLSLKAGFDAVWTKGQPPKEAIQKPDK